MIKEEAIEILSDMRAEYNIFSDDEEEATRYHALSWAIQALNEQQRTGRWIPVSERLPERGTSILMSSRQGWVAEGEYKGVLDGCHLWIEYRWSASLTNGEIIAWMPLPKPYGGE